MYEVKGDLWQMSITIRGSLRNETVPQDYGMRPGALLDENKNDSLGVMVPFSGEKRGKTLDPKGVGRRETPHHRASH